MPVLPRHLRRILAGLLACLIALAVSDFGEAHAATGDVESTEAVAVLAHVHIVYDGSRADHCHGLSGVGCQTAGILETPGPSGANGVISAAFRRPFTANLDDLYIPAPPSPPPNLL